MSRLHPSIQGKSIRLTHRIDTPCIRVFRSTKSDIQLFSKSRCDGSSVNQSFSQHRNTRSSSTGMPSRNMDAINAPNKPLSCLRLNCSASLTQFSFSPRSMAPATSEMMPQASLQFSCLAPQGQERCDHWKQAIPHPI